jgi:hypothetical protein
MLAALLLGAHYVFEMHQFHLDKLAETASTIQGTGYDRIALSEIALTTMQVTDFDWTLGAAVSNYYIVIYGLTFLS